MLDLNTVLVVTFAIACLQAIAWTFVWLAWRHLYELRFLAAGLAAIALGLFLMIVRGLEPAAWSIVLANLVIKIGLVLLAEGLARFLGQPRYSWIGVSLLVFQLVSWSIAIGIAPGNLAIRIHLSTVFTVIMMSIMCLGLLRDRTQPRLLRWITIGILVEYMVASILQSVIEQGLPASGDALVLADHNGWYLMQGALFQIAFFACVLFMVNTRLSTDLREKNEALSREIEERRRLETKLSASLEAERALREEQADFMRVVSHEFRTPLAIIRNATQMISLVGHKSPEATRERIAGISEALNRLFSLINRFMSDDRENRFQPEPLTIGSLLLDVRLHFGMTNQGERLTLTADDERTSFLADPEMLTTIIINLIDNALKYSPPDQPIDVDVRRRDSDLIIQVRDRGIGIPASELHKIGRRFFRASNAATRGGSGLGLYTSRKLLDYHGGALQLNANSDRGMTATVSLPLPVAATAQPHMDHVTA
ncbi:HAMP domain-containing sensor histidine kinase [uncultured Nitratireductor sp.]|uniref:sensor histidine kinase n=1 Tax=uncultured Nitratireductor sp. TaxID=520953 RepID=UPI0025FE0D1E|nr:HAMP domain-containing sensor histidine kinase [uncultured Nitratireductor sp.]